MNGLQVVAISAVALLSLLASIADLQKKKIRMYKERYEKALRSGDQQQIQATGRDYYKNLAPKLNEGFDIEAAIQKDMQARS
jgi:hypothetical protein